MRKRLITPAPETGRSRSEGWLDVQRAALVEITSEEKDYPVESAFVSGEAQGWRDAETGRQTIRLVFDQPQRLKQISLIFEEKETARTQEFVLRWSSDGGNSFREIVRQQWNFSHPETIREVEEYQVELSKRHRTRVDYRPEYEWRKCSRLAQESAPVLTRDRVFSRTSNENDTFSRKNCPAASSGAGQLFVTSVRQLGRFLPGSLWAP